MALFGNPTIEINEIEEVTLPSRYYSPQAVIGLVNQERNRNNNKIYIPSRGDIFAWLNYISSSVKLLLPEQCESSRIKILDRNSEILTLDQLIYSESGNIRKDMRFLIYRTLRTAYMQDILAEEYRKFPLDKKPDFYQHFGIDSDETVENNRVYLEIYSGGRRKKISEPSVISGNLQIA